MRSGKLQQLRRPIFQPFLAARIAFLNAEEITFIARRRQNHILAALRAHISIEALDGNRAIQRAVKNSEVMRERADITLLRVTGRNRLWT